MNITEHRTKVIMESLSDSCDFLEAMEYGEPGYSNPEKSILLANWNNVSDRVQDYLEEAGFSLEWSDEWIIDYSSGKAYRCVPDSYDWKPAYIQNDWTNGEIIGIDEIENDIELMDEYINEYLLNNSYAVSQCDIENRLVELGYTKLDESFENGFHPGQTNEPEKILNYWNDKGYDLVFSGYESSQFYISFEAYVKKQGD